MRGSNDRPIYETCADNFGSSEIVAMVCVIIVVARPPSRNPAPKSTKINGVYVGLRNKALHTTGSMVGQARNADKNAPFGTVADLGFPEGTATVVAMIDGTASMYFSGGGGYIGGQGRPAIAGAAKEAVAAAAAAVPQMHRAHEFPLPAEAQVRLYVLTDDGVVTALKPVGDLHDEATPLGHLYAAVQDVITQYRLMNQQ